MVSKETAYLLMLPSLIGVCGIQRFYLGKYGTGVLWLVTFGLFGIGTLIDLFTLGEQVAQKNSQAQIRDLTSLTMAQASVQQQYPQQSYPYDPQAHHQYPPQQNQQPPQHRQQ